MTLHCLVNINDINFILDQFPVKKTFKVGKFIKKAEKSILIENGAKFANFVTWYYAREK